MTTTTNKQKAHTAGHRQLSYDTTRWERVLFDRRAGQGALGTAIQTVASQSLAVSGAVGRGARQAIGDAADWGTEVFARFYNDPAALPVPATDPAWAAQAHQLAEGLPEFQALRQAVSGDPDLSALAAAEIMQSLAPKVGELARMAKADDDARRAQRQAKNGQAGNGNAPAQAGRSTDLATSKDAAAVRAALRAAIGRAQQRTGQVREGLAGLAPGLESAPPTHQQDSNGRLLLAERLLQDPRLRDVLRRAGRIARLARERRTTRDQHARQEVVDVERGADLARILPSGLARLRHPLLRKLALREIVERQAIQYRLEGRETLSRGPIVVMVDRSSSMRGDGEAWAAATAIALVGAGVREGRPVTVVEFTCSVDTAIRVQGGRGVQLSPINPAVRLAAADLSIPEVAVQLATRRSDGGTDFGPVLRYGMDCGVLDDRADLVFVTDGLASADDDVMAQLVDAKKRGLRVYALTVNGGSLSPSIARIADAAVDLDRADDVAAAIAAAMPS